MINERKITASTVLVVFASMACIFAAKDILVPIILAAFLATLCLPVTNTLNTAGLPRGLSILITFGAILCLGIVLVGFVSNTATDFMRNSKDYTGDIKGIISSIPYIEQVLGDNVNVSEIASMLSPSTAMNYVAGAFSGLRGIISKVFFISLISIFILMESGLFHEKLIVLCCGRDDMVDKVSDFTASLKNYIFIKTMTSAATGIAIGILLWAFGIKYAALFGVIAFALNFIPTIGSILASFPAIAFALLNYGAMDAALVAVIYLTANITIGSVIEPRILGRGLGISPTFVLLSLVFWGWMLGIAGMFLSVPLTVMIKIACQNSERWHFLSVILGDKAAHREESKTKNANLEGNINAEKENLESTTSTPS